MSQSDVPQTGAGPQAPAPKKGSWDDLAAHPEKVLGYDAVLLLLGLLQRFIPGVNGLVIIAAPLVLALVILPGVMAGVVLHKNRATVTDSGRAMMIIPAVICTAFGIYLLAWSVS